MFILEKPYVSDILAESLSKNQYPTLKNDTASALSQAGINLLSDAEFVAEYKKNPAQPVYSNSENAISWIDEHLDFSPLPKAIRLFKDKAEFRRKLSAANPDFFFQEVLFENLDTIDPSKLPLPCVLKPAVGFFSLGVHMIESVEGWHKAVQAVQNDVEKIQKMYPAKVLEVDRFIIEQCIEGEEFAVDAYYDEDGEPVILNILGHIFASSEDVSDRVYYTSVDVIQKYREKFIEALKAAGKGSDLKNFPLHAEIRVDRDGALGFIEVNPMRFAGWCVTDLAYYAYGINNYEAFMSGRHPDWDKIYEKHKNKVYAMILGEIDGSVDFTKIRDVDYDSFKSLFKKPLALRRIDYKKHPVFAFMFAEYTKDEMSELKKITTVDFNKYLIV
jgi:hypothetical protein